MDRKAIETLSVNAVRDSVVVSDFLDQFIADNDKEPTWDGFVYIYSDKSKKKKKLKGRLPVQIKGTEKDDFSKEEISFPVSTTDLNNYLYDGGVVFFVVYIGHNGLTRQIYYAELPPIKLRVYLADAKEQKSKSIKLKKFPTDPNEKAMIFFQCLENCQKQASFSSAQLLSLEELESQGVLEGITVPVSTVGGIDPKTALLKNEVYIYAKIKGSAIPQPIEAIPQKLTTQETRDAQVSVGDRLFYSTVRVVQDAETITTIFGESLSIKTSKNDRTVKISYKNSDKLRTLIVDLDFLLSYIEAGSFQWNGVDLPFDYNGADFSNFKLEEEKSRLEYAKKIVALLDLFGCKKDLSIKTLKDKDWKHIGYLVTAFVDKEPVEHLRTDLPPIMTIDIGELKFIVCLRKIEGKDGTYSIFDFFKTEMSLVYENEAGEKLPISQYVILHADDLIKADNIRYDVLLPSFQNTAQHEETITRANFFLLELLEAYDKANSRTEFLSVARSFSDWIFVSNDGSLPYDVKLLNKLQIEKRERALTIDEVKELFRVIETPGVREDVLVGAYLLLDQQAAAELHFEKLDKQLQEEFKKYPIFHFLERKRRKFIMDKLRMQTANKADENFRKLAAMFPNAVTETINENGEVVRAIDKDVLMQEINTKVVDGKEERYQFTWPDKKKSVLLANAPINKTLRPCREESVDFDTTENLYIEGDNLEVLKLLQETYLGKVKMIYIDIKTPRLIQFNYSSADFAA